MSESDDTEDEPDDEPVETGGNDVEDPFDAARALVESRAVDGIFRRLQAQFADLDQADVEDAVYTAFERLARREAGPPDNPRAWVLRVARNRLLDQRRRKRVDLLDEDDDLVLGSERSAEDQALSDEAYRAVCEHVQRTWSSERLKTVVLLVLEAAVFVDPVDNAELARLSSQILREEITTGAAATLKSRGLARLRDELPTIFDEVLFDPKDRT